MKKFRLTPLNIIIALALSLLIVTFFQKQPRPQHVDVSGIYQLLLVALILVSFVTDLIFRFTLKELKKIWIVETIFITITVILILILQK